jgi:hypothetical protein
MALRCCRTARKILFVGLRTQGEWPKGMMKNLDLVEPTKIDTAASDSCARSGAFALLLSLALGVEERQ